MEDGYEATSFGIENEIDHIKSCVRQMYKHLISKLNERIH